jgi:hypothetical protein
MQTLPPDFNQYVNNFKFHNLLLQFADNTHAKVHLKYLTTTQQNCIIKRGWKKFCQDNNISFGDTLMFRFIENGQNVCNVTKLNL